MSRLVPIRLDTITVRHEHNRRRKPLVRLVEVRVLTLRDTSRYPPNVMRRVNARNGVGRPPRR